MAYESEIEEKLVTVYDWIEKHRENIKVGEDVLEHNEVDAILILIGAAMNVMDGVYSEAIEQIDEVGEIVEGLAEDSDNAVPSGARAE